MELRKTATSQKTRVIKHRYYGTIGLFRICSVIRQMIMRLWENEKMKFVIQVVSQASVEIEGSIRGSIGRGMLVLVGVGQDDNEAVADKMVSKLLGMRIFPDENGKTNLSLSDVGGELLIISQFTLYADCRKGNRPSFTGAGDPEEARRLYEYIVDKCRNKEPGAGKVETGEFGAKMKVSLVNEGPFTIILDSADLNI